MCVIELKISLKLYQPESVLWDMPFDNLRITMYFWNNPNKYIFVDGHQYWVMRDGEDDPTIILNRCDLSQYKLLITWKGAEG